MGGCIRKSDHFQPLFNNDDIAFNIRPPEVDAGCSASTLITSVVGTNTACNVTALPSWENLMALETKLRTT